MSFISAAVKTAFYKVNQMIYHRDSRQAQKKAYNDTCKKSCGQYNNFWHRDYTAALKANQQKAQDKKELRDKFIDNL